MNHQNKKQGVTTMTSHKHSHSHTDEPAGHSHGVNDTPVPFESGDLKKDHTAAKEDVNRAAVHVSDSLRVAFERMGTTTDAKHVAAMNKITKDLQAVLEDVNALAAKESATKE